MMREEGGHIITTRGVGVSVQQNQTITTNIDIMLFSVGMEGPSSVWGAKHVAYLESRLQEKLGPEYQSVINGVKQTRTVVSLPGWEAINVANQVFGFDGWSSEIKDFKVDSFENNPNGRFKMRSSAIIRITLKDGTFHEDIGYGQAEMDCKALAYEKCKKEATTDGLKRTLRMFGSILGDSLFEQHYSNTNVVKEDDVTISTFEQRYSYKRKTATGFQNPEQVKRYKMNILDGIKEETSFIQKNETDTMHTDNYEFELVLDDKDLEVDGIPFIE